MKAVVLRKFRLAITLGLILWCAGAGCMLVSYAHGASMADPEAATAPANGSIWAGLSASAGAHSCCKARLSSQHAPAHSRASVAAGLNEVALTKSSSSSDKMSCCPLTSGTLVLTARQSVSDGQASEVIKSSAPALVLADVHATRRALPLRLPNQSQTYVRGCAFLI